MIEGMAARGARSGDDLREWLRAWARGRRAAQPSRPRPSRGRAVLLAVTIGGAHSVLASEPRLDLVGDELQVNRSTIGDQTRPTIAPLPGGFVVVWESPYIDASGQGIAGVLLDIEGRAVGDEFVVNQGTDGPQYRPRVSANAMGDFVVSWSAGGEVVARSFGADGAPRSGEVQVSSYVTGGQGASRVSLGGGDPFVAVWHSAGSPGPDDSFQSIQARRVGLDGLPVGAQFEVNSFTPYPQLDPDVLAGPDGDFVVAWRSSYDTGVVPELFYSSRIVVRRFSASAEPIGIDSTVSAPVAVAPGSAGFEQSRPRIVHAGEGSSVLLWHREVIESDYVSTIEARRVASDGTPVGEQFRVSDPDLGIAAFPSVAPVASGYFVVVWQSGSAYFPGQPDGSGYSIQGRLFGPEGPVGAEMTINAYTPGPQRLPEVAASDPHHVLVGWEGPGDPGNGDVDLAIHARRLEVVLPIFDDDFESGGTAYWSAVAP